MTIGFSIVAPKKVFINQVQMVDKKVNRRFYKFVANRFEIVIDRFFKYFPGFEIYLTDGNRLADNTLRQKKGVLQKDLERLGKSRQQFIKYYKKSAPEDKIHLHSSLIYSLKAYHEDKKVVDEFEESGYPKLRKSYSVDLGKYLRLCQSEERLGFLFHKLARRA